VANSKLKGNELKEYHTLTPKQKRDYFYMRTSRLNHSEAMRNIAWATGTNKK